MKDQEVQHRKRRKTLIILLLLILLIGLVTVLLFLFGVLPTRGTRDGQVEQVEGTRFQGFDDFYEAPDGLWRTETTFHLLKTQKYVSSEMELEHFLVYKAEPGEIVRVKQDDARWKLVEVISNDTVLATGWVDADKLRAERIEILRP